MSEFTGEYTRLTLPLPVPGHRPQGMSAGRVAGPRCCCRGRRRGYCPTPRQGNAGIAALLELAERAYGKVVAGRALLLVNERADVALAAGADGVQLGEAALPTGAVRAIWVTLRLLAFRPFGIGRLRGGGDPAPTSCWWERCSPAIPTPAKNLPARTCCPESRQRRRNHSDAGNRRHHRI